MFDLTSLSVPIIQAPMAGGPATPALAAAVGDAGGLGFLAAGYLSADALASDIREIRRRTRAVFGVNVFVPEAQPVPAQAVRHERALAAYRDALSPLADSLGVALPPHVSWDDDGYDAKIDVLERQRVPVITFTFGLPDAETVVRLHRVGTCLGATVASADDAVAATSAGVDFVVLQGPGAGGHRATIHVADRPDALGLPAMLAAAKEHLRVPIVAAGGVSCRGDVEGLLAAGAVAVQVGTLFLLTDEAGTRPVHRAALENASMAETVVTRAFSGRPARGLRNAFTDAFSDLAPALYPQVNALTTPIRTEASRLGDVDHVHLWAGEGHRSCRTEPAAETIARLMPSEWTAAALS